MMLSTGAVRRLMLRPKAAAASAVCPKLLVRLSDSTLTGSAPSSVGTTLRPFDGALTSSSPLGFSRRWKNTSSLAERAARALAKDKKAKPTMQMALPTIDAKEGTGETWTAADTSDDAKDAAVDVDADADATETGASNDAANTTTDDQSSRSKEDSGGPSEEGQGVRVTYQAPPAAAGHVHQSPRGALPPAAHQGHLHEFAPRIVVVGVGGAGGNAVNNMIARNLSGVDFLALNTDAQHLSTTLTDNRLQIGGSLTSGLGCGANPDAGRLAAEESRDQITDLLNDAHMVFITAGMGGGTGTGAAPVVAEICYNLGILTVGVVTKPFRFEGTHRMRLATEGITRLRDVVDTLIVIPNQNLFSLVSDKTSFMESFAMADDVLLAGVKSITDLMTTPGLINLDFADVQSVMHGMGNAMLGTGQACSGEAAEDRAVAASEQALANPLLGESMDIGTAKGMLVNITGGKDMTLFEVDRAAQLITERVEDANANIIFGSAYDESLDGCIRVSVVATGIDEGSEGSKSGT